MINYYLLKLQLIYAKDKLIKSFILLTFISRKKEKKAIKAQYVFIKSNMIGEILKDNRVKRKKVLRKQLFNIFI